MKQKDHTSISLQIPVKNKDGTSFSKINETSAQSEKADNAGSGAGDHCVPFPRTCGAKWCGVGILVVFNRPPNAKRMSLKPESSTPRSLSSLSTPVLIVGHYRSLSPHLTTSPSPTNLVMNFLHHRPPSHSITTFYFQDRWVSLLPTLTYMLSSDVLFSVYISEIINETIRQWLA